MIERMRRIIMHPFSRDVSYLTLGSFGKTIVAFIASIFITRLLGVELYGTYAIAMSVASVILMFTRYSYDYSMTTVLAEKIGEEDREEVQNSIVWFLKNILVSNAILLIFIVLVPFVTERLYPDLESLGSYVQIYLLSVFFAAFFSLVRILLQTARRIKLLAILDVSKDLTWRFIAILLLVAGLEILGVVLAQLVTSLILGILSFYLYVRIAQDKVRMLPTFREILSRWRSVSFFRHLRFTFAVTIDNNLASLYTSLPVFFLGLMSTTTEAAYLNLALNIIAVPKLIAGNIATMLSSVLPFKKGRQEIRDQHWRRDFYRAMKVSFITMAGLFLIFWIGSYFFLPFIYGEDFSGTLYALSILIFINLGIGITLGIGPLLRTIKRVDLAIKYNAVGMVAMIAVMMATIPQHGAVGAALGMFAWKLAHWALSYHMFRLLNTQQYDAAES